MTVKYVENKDTIIFGPEYNEPLNLEPNIQIQCKKIIFLILS